MQSIVIKTISAILMITLCFGYRTAFAEDMYYDDDSEYDELLIDTQIKAAALGEIIGELRAGNNICGTGAEYFDLCQPDGDSDGTDSVMVQNIDTLSTPATVIPPINLDDTIGGREIQIGNQSVNGGCYLSQLVNVAPSNKVLTTGQYEQIDPAFEKGLQSVFRKEGTCKDVGDGQGMTCFGITSASNAKFFADNFWQLSTQQKIAKAEKWYYEHFYINNDINKLPDSIRGDVFAMRVAGPNYFAIAMMVLDMGQLPQERAYVNIPGQYTKYTKSGAKVSPEIIEKCVASTDDLHTLLMDAYSAALLAKNRPKPPKKPECTGKCNNIPNKWKPQSTYGAKYQKGWQNAVTLLRANGCHVEPTGTSLRRVAPTTKRK